MKRLFDAAADLQQFFVSKSWDFCFIGGIAVQRWGQPRLTTDVDVTLVTGLGSESDFIDPLCERYQLRRADARAFALANRVLLLMTADNTPLDIALGCFPFESQVVQRSSCFHFTVDVELRTCSAEDLVVLKAFADRPRDWADVQTIIERQRDGFDRGYILRHLAALTELKEAPEILTRLEQLFEDAP